MSEDPLKGIARALKPSDFARRKAFQNLPEKRARKPLEVIARAWAQYEYERTRAKQSRHPRTEGD